MNTFFKKLKRNYYRQKLGRRRAEYEYDVYLSYGHSDSEFAVGTIGHILENFYELKCCIPNRDFSVGGMLKQHISHHVSRSQMSIIVLSEKSLLNPIQYMERNIVHNAEIQTFLRHKVIYIYVGGVADSDDSSVRGIVESNVGLKYDDSQDLNWQVAFFEKLSGKIYKSLTQPPTQPHPTWSL